MNVGIAIVILLATIIIGLPIPLAFLGSAIYLIFFAGYDPSFLISYGYSKMGSPVLLCIPMFIIAGALMTKGGIGAKLVSAVEKILGRIRGSLGIVSVVTCAVFGAVSGSSAATLSAIGGTMFPRLEEAGYDKGFSAALLASSGVLGLLIPPSSIMILFAWIGNQSVLASFLATAVPGIMLVIGFSIVTYIYAKKHPSVRSYTKEEYKQMRAEMKQQKFSLEKSAIPAVLMPVLILGSIYTGVMTPTEAAALSVVYAVPVGLFIYKKLTLGNLKETLIQAGCTTGVIMVMLFAIMILSRLYITEQLPQKILTILTSISDSKTVILIMINIFLVFVGMIMDDNSGMLLGTPILLPIVTELGMDPIHFAAIIGVNLGMGNITPPTAPLLYLSGRISGAELKDMLKPTLLLMLFVWFPVLMLVTFIPEISLFLPRLIMGYGA